VRGLGGDGGGGGGSTGGCGDKSGGARYKRRTAPHVALLRRCRILLVFCFSILLIADEKSCLCKFL
jgi:hypothetical protein